MMLPRTRLLLVLFALSVPAVAQTLAVGVKAGGIISDEMIGGYSATESPFYLVGPTIDVSLPWRSLSFEADALYHRFGVSWAFTTDLATGGTASARERANWFEFPLLLKFRSSAGLFVSGGVSPRILGGRRGHMDIVDYDRQGNLIQDVHQDYTPDYGGPSLGLVGGAGGEFATGRHQFTAELRYTRWLSRPIDLVLSQGSQIRSDQNQLSLLLGWSIRPRR